MGQADFAGARPGAAPHQASMADGVVRRAEGPVADLSIAIASASSQQGIPVASDLAIIGEIGLSGEMRSMTQVEKPIGKAGKLGFRRVLLPRSRRNGDDHGTCASVKNTA